MTKIHHVCFVVLLTALISCWARPASESEKKRAFNRSDYDVKIIQNLDKYTILKDFLLHHLDTIISYRNSKNIVTVIGENSNVKDIRQVDERCWDFTTADGPIDITHVPSFISHTLDSLIKNLGQDMFNNFSICNDGTLEFKIRYVRNYNINNINVLHMLRWDKINTEDYGCDYSKDTLLGAKWDYEICVFGAHGW